MSQEAPKTSVAKVRGDAISHVDTMKSLISIGMHADTPVICLACRISNQFGTECNEKRDMHGKVANAWNWESGPDTPLIEICDGFVSNEAVVKPQE